MREVTITIPEWAEERRVFVFLGVECYMVYEPEEKQWYIKVERCNRCGKCCQNVSDKWPHGSQVIDGIQYCGGIRKISDSEYVCEAANVPFGCERDLPHQLPHPDCVMRYVKFDTSEAV